MKIRDAFSRQVRDLIQMAKVAKIAQKTQIQGVPYLGFNLNQIDSPYISFHQDGRAEESFDLIPGRSEHCSIQVNIKLFRKRTKYEKNCNKTCIALCCAFVPSVLIAQATNCSNQREGGRSPNLKFVEPSSSAGFHIFPGTYWG